MQAHEARLLLGLPGCGPLSVESVKQAFRSCALYSHPDKGGSDAKFVEVKEACRVLLRQILGEAGGGERHTEEDRRAYAEQMMRGDRMDLNQFNAEFERTRVPSAFDEGYGDMMEQSTSAREDIDVPMTRGLTAKSGRSAFNAAFNRRARELRESREVAQVRQPLHGPAPSRLDAALSIAELGVERVSDFSGAQSGLSFTDYKMAYEQAPMDPSSVKKKRFKDVEHLQRFRDDPRSTRMTSSLRRQLAAESKASAQEEAGRAAAMLREHRAHESMEMDRLSAVRRITAR